MGIIPVDQTQASAPSVGAPGSAGPSCVRGRRGVVRRDQWPRWWRASRCLNVRARSGNSTIAAPNTTRGELKSIARALRVTPMTGRRTATARTVTPGAARLRRHLRGMGLQRAVRSMNTPMPPAGNRARPRSRRCHRQQAHGQAQQRSATQHQPALAQPRDQPLRIQRPGQPADAIQRHHRARLAQAQAEGGVQVRRHETRRRQKPIAPPAPPRSAPRGPRARRSTPPTCCTRRAA